VVIRLATFVYSKHTKCAVAAVVKMIRWKHDRREAELAAHFVRYVVYRPHRINEMRIIAICDPVAYHQLLYSFDRWRHFDAAITIYITA